MGKAPAESLADARAVMDAALQASKGMRVTFDSERAAKQFRQRLYSARLRDRDQTRKMYEVGDSKRGKSPYDFLSIVLLKSGTFWVVDVLKADRPYGAVEVEEIS